MLRDGSVIALMGAYRVGRLLEPTLHRFAPDGRALPGWPFHGAAGDICPDLEVDAHAVIYLVCGNERASTLVALDSGGSVTTRWEIDLPFAEGLRLGPDGIAYIYSADDRDRPLSGAHVAAMTADGSVKAGWPIAIRGPINGFELTPAGVLVLSWFERLVGELCSSPEQVFFTSIDGDGRTMPGWPKRVGDASGPVIGADGTIFTFAPEHDMLAFDPDGSTKDGWPVTIPEAMGSCGPAVPTIGPDGTVYLASGVLTALDQDGRSLPGWPYQPVDDLYNGCVGWTDCASAPVPPQVTSGGASIAVYRGWSDGATGTIDIVAIDGQGRVKSGWPYPLPKGTMEAGLSVAPDGRSFVIFGKPSDREHSTILALSDPPPPPPGFTEAEWDLVASLRADARAGCEPRRNELPPRAIAGVECTLDTDLVSRVGAYRFGDDRDAAATYLEKLAEFGVLPGTGDCNGGKAGDASWIPENPSPDSLFRRGCFLNEARIANVRVTCGDATYIGILGKTDDLDALMAWTQRHLPNSPVGTPTPPGICRG